MVGQPQSTGTKVLLVVMGVLGSALVAAVALFGMQAFDRLLHRSREAANHGPTTPASPAQARSERTAALIAVAPAPLPTALPIVERPGADAFGYPRSYVDEPALRSLLHYERHRELSTYIEQLQSAFEADPTKEMWPAQAADAFASAEPELLAKLEAWARATPDSFAPQLALGAHWTAQERARRGSHFAKDTPAEDFEAMREAARFAQTHLTRALTKRPKLVAAQRYLISVTLLDGQRKLLDDTLADALRTCPGCYGVRVSYMFSLQPRWGGSFPAMTTFARQAPIALNPKLKLLMGYVEAERARVAFDDKGYDSALTLINLACDIADHADFLEQRAEIWMAKQDLLHAQQDLDLAVELRPELTSPRLTRAELFVKKQDWERAAADILNVMRVDPTASGARWAAGRTAWGLDRDGWAAHNGGDRARAVKLLELATQLVPFDSAVRNHMAAAVRGDVKGTPDDLAQLEARIQALPDDFSAHQQLDYALAQQRKYPRVIEMWTEYLSRHPNDGPAYFERSGAYHNSGHRAEAMSDLDKACHAGVNQACAFLQRLGQK